jgi:hypothetical protein
MKSELIQCLGSGLAAKAVELLPMDRMMYPMSPLQPKTAQKMSLKSGRFIRSETEITQITIGLAWRRTARRTRRLREDCSIIGV